MHAQNLDGRDQQLAQQIGEEVNIPFVALSGVTSITIEKQQFLSLRYRQAGIPARRPQ
jgi:hypothetical protein